MKICFVDEAGCTGKLPTHDSRIQPAFVLTGMIIDYLKLRTVTERLLQHKQRFFPNAVRNTHYLSGILDEVKGSDLRRNAASRERNVRRHTFGYLDGIMSICEDANVRLIGRVWIKNIGENFDGLSVYTSSVQRMCEYFQKYLTQEDELGFIIADSRLKPLNSQVAHSIFTQKFRIAGDCYDRIIELPAFAHSDNHAGLQIADTVCSGIVFPIAVETYCRGILNSIHVRDGFDQLKTRYADRLRMLQFRYQDESGASKGELVVSDGLTKRPGGLLFRTDSNG